MPFQQFISTRWVSQSAFCEAVWQGHYLARVSSNLYPTLLSIFFFCSLAFFACLRGFLRLLAFCACPPFCHCLPFVTACFSLRACLFRVHCLPTMTMSLKNSTTKSNHNTMAMMPMNARECMCCVLMLLFGRSQPVARVYERCQCLSSLC